MTRRGSRAEYENKRQLKKEDVQRAARNSRTPVTVEKPIKPGTRVKVLDGKVEQIYSIVDLRVKDATTGPKEDGEIAISPKSAVGQALMSINVLKPQNVTVYLPNNETRTIKFLDIITESERIDRK